MSGRMNFEKIAALTADPDTAREAFEQFGVTFPTTAEQERVAILLAHLFAASPFLVNWFSGRPDDCAWVCDPDHLLTSRDQNKMTEHLASLVERFPDDRMKAFRLFKHRELARICAREASFEATLEDSLSEWTMVADVALHSAIELCMADALTKHGAPLYTEMEEEKQQEAKLAAIAMGKMGGEELNISSDIDIIFIHSSDRGETCGNATGGGEIALHQFFVQVAREVTKLLNEVTPDGFVFRVDLDLRPEGRAGELTNSVGAMETYYESCGQTWERQALLKARYAGGDRAIVDDILERLHPFVYRKYYDADAIANIAAMKEKVDASLKSRTGKRGLRNIKLGRGGIREIEFVVQSIQLLYGARYPELRTRQTLPALRAASALGLVSDPHCRDLAEAYGFYRRLENRIQYHQNLQTHDLPDDPSRLATLARQLGIGGKDPGSLLEEEVERRRDRVRAIFSVFFTQEKEETARFPAPLDDTDAIIDWLDSLSFDRPRMSADLLFTLRNGRPYTQRSEASRGRFDRFGPVLVAEAAATSWPDNVLLGFERFVTARTRRGLYTILESNLPLLKLLAALFSSSEHLTTILLRQPGLFDRLIGADPVGSLYDRNHYREEFALALAGEKDLGHTLDALNNYRASESLRLGLRRLLNISDRFALMQGLSALAEEYLRALFRLAARGTGEGDLHTWVAVAGGKLGRGEMNYGSDIDLMIFYEGDQKTADFVTRFAQQGVSLAKKITPHGAGYEIDMRLRPEGGAGPLALSFDAMRDYYKIRGQAWERMALVGARVVAGDTVFGKKVMAEIRRFVVEPPLTPADIKGIALLRDRIVTEKVKPGVLDIKFGRGGLIEIEFIMQLLRMADQKTLADSGETPFTIGSLRMAEERTWLPRTDIHRLEEAYLFYRSIEDALRMDREQALNVAPQKGDALVRVARRAAIDGVGPERFVAALKETMKEVRKIYENFMRERSV